MCSCKSHQCPAIETRNPTHKLRRHRPSLIKQRWVVLHNPLLHKMVERKKVFALASTVKVSSAKRQRPEVLVYRFQERFRGCKPAYRSHQLGNLAIHSYSPEGNVWGIHLARKVRALALCVPSYVSYSRSKKKLKIEIHTLSTIRPRPVDPNVSIAKYSPSSILVWSSFFTSITDFPP